VSGVELELRVAWQRHLGTSAAAAEWFDTVLGAYRAEGRHYHGVRHVAWVVRHVVAIADDHPVGDLDATVAAAFFHDAIYDPQATDNEERSAQLAERVLGQLGWDAPRRSSVGALVRATADHGPAPDDDTAVLLDADLAVLGAEPAAYQAYVTGVRAEYAHVDAEAWRAGRGAVLRGLLARRPIYSTAPARARWEARAAANMVAELASL